MMNFSQEEKDDLLDKLSQEKAVELLPVSVYVFVMMVVGLCGNVLVCVFYCRKCRTTPTSRLIVAVAVIDTIICILMPKNIVDISLSYKFTSAFLCKLNNFVNHTTAISSVMVLVAIAAFRFRAVCRPFASQFSLRHANISIAIAVVFSLLVSVPVLVTQESVPINIPVNEEDTIEGYDCISSKKPGLKPVNLALNVVHFFIFISTTLTFLVLYGIMAVNILKYYRTKKILMGKASTSVRSTTSDHTSKSELHSGNSCLSDDHSHDTKTEKHNVHEEKIKISDETGKTHQLGPKEKYDSEKSGNTMYPSLNKSTEQFNEDSDVDKQCLELNDLVTDKENEVNDVVETKHVVTFDKDYTKPDIKEQSKKPTSDHMEEYKISSVAVKQTIMLFIITVIFILSFLPYIAMNTARTLSKNKDGDSDFTNWIQFCTRSYLINSASNPFVYGLFNSEFRNFVKGILCRCCRNNK